MLYNKEVVKHEIAHWLIDMACSAHVRNFVVGVSGGIDSAVTAMLCTEAASLAIDDLHLYAIGLPCYNAFTQNTNMNKMLATLNTHKNVTTRCYSLNDVLDSFLGSVDVAFESEKYDLARANAISRLRMTSLYYIANAIDGLVVGTGNYIEDQVLGFCTKYGDHGVDISPLGTLYKSEVYELAETFPDIPKEVIEAKPTDGLWIDGRSDEDQLGFTYAQAESVLKYEGGSSDQIFENFIKEIYPKISARRSANVHKTKMPPVFNVKPFRKE